MAEEEELMPYIMFGDGTFATFKRMNPVIVKEGNIEEDCYEFYLKPLAKLRRKWKISERDSNFINMGALAGFYKCTYKKKWCAPLDLSPDSAVWLLSTDYKGRSFIDVSREKFLTMWQEKINNYTTQIASLRAQIASLTIEMIKMSRNPSLYMKKYGERVKEIVDLTAPQYIGGGTESGEGRE